ncbi:hypothetical protein Baya_2509 [Bagarius yarrelli]|uniref:Uncharacterized protein n=1 Tax=Bagarius yarrelli TaxID=175774 RepID=A0A556VXW3_BAGYA|nr:hypothetical protein Baya_2509 [Bagarius yarrelli]
MISGTSTAATPKIYCTSQTILEMHRGFVPSLRWFNPSRYDVWVVGTEVVRHRQTHWHSEASRSSLFFSSTEVQMSTSRSVTEQQLECDPGMRHTHLSILSDLTVPVLFLRNNNAKGLRPSSPNPLALLLFIIPEAHQRVSVCVFMCVCVICVPAVHPFTSE